MLGFDVARPINAEIANALAKDGYIFAGRYLIPESYWNSLTRQEAEIISAAGMHIVSIFEINIGDAAEGATMGKIHGAQALQEAKRIRQPKGTAIYFTVDYDAQPEDYDHIESYLNAVAKQLPEYQIGVYGHYDVIEAMAQRKACRYFWQTQAWSSGRKSAFMHLYQREQTKISDLVIDVNDAFSNAGWWNTVDNG